MSYCNGDCINLEKTKRHTCDKYGKKLTYIKQSGSISFTAHEQCQECKTDEYIVKLSKDRDYWRDEALKQAAVNGEKKIEECLLGGQKTMVMCPVPGMSDKQLIEVYDNRKAQGLERCSFVEFLNKVNQSKVKLSEDVRLGNASAHVSLTICPECKGEGTVKIFNGDSHDKEECKFCGGKRVVKQITTVAYEKLDI